MKVCCFIIFLTFFNLLQYREIEKYIDIWSTVLYDKFYFLNSICCILEKAITNN